MSTYIVTRLDQAKLLSDAFKLKLLERFSGDPATTKQVADRMGEKAPRLYRHVDALVEAGLLELVEERPKRGTVERYYRTVAERFEVDPELFSGSPVALGEAASMMRSIFRQTESDLLTILESDDEACHDGDTPPIIMRLSIRGSADDISMLNGKLQDFVDECNALAVEHQDTEDDVNFAGLVAFYPVTDE